jgi:hypothetical protein
MKGFHIEGMTQDKGNPFLLTEVRQPLPREDTLHSHDQIVPIGSNDPQKGFRGRRQILMNQLRATLIEDTDVHGLRM